ncbi:intracellular short-chain-length polyhydroxyalkanoate depolymerase [Viridibacillus arvi]|uniref:3-oxoadipate enol-lactonase n=1 Tax=Viridibacillus arvi TaxID=263475 RepID=A0A0M0LD98_9BACL|nr:alpha/beta hydrolase [Viridibacillus arvi]KOO48882.1 3-oxoadipate enol-lactonase [Viridibacillus arvi]
MTLQQDVLKKVLLSNGETIAYRERAGGDELIILVHGNMTSSKHWDVLMEELDGRFTILSPDLRGFGQSSYHKRVSHIRDFSEDLKLWVDALGLKDFTLVGWSTGGAVAMQFCADYLGLCHKLVLLASASTRGYAFYASNPDGSPNLLKRLLTLEEVEKDSVKTVPMQNLYDSGNREGLKAVWNALIYTHKQPSELQYEAYIDDMLTQRNLADVYHVLNTFNISSKKNEVSHGQNEVAKIQIPTLIIYGDRDYVVPETMTKEIIEDFEGRAKVVKLSDSGHSPLIDDLTQLVNQIELFI